MLCHSTTSCNIFCYSAISCSHTLSEHNLLVTYFVNGQLPVHKFYQTNILGSRTQSYYKVLVTYFVRAQFSDHIYFVRAQCSGHILCQSTMLSSHTLMEHNSMLTYFVSTIFQSHIQSGYNFLLTYFVSTILQSHIQSEYNFVITHHISKHDFLVAYFVTITAQLSVNLLFQNNFLVTRLVRVQLCDHTSLSEHDFLVTYFNCHSHSTTFC